MLLIRALLLWSMLSLHVVGGAAIFRRLFPRESPWLGFVVPCLALIVALNFLEHFVAVCSLLWLLPVTTLGSIWAIFHPKLEWRGFHLPTWIFLVALAFTLGVRAMKPDILATRDGMFDFSLMASFCSGDKVPPPLNWDSDLPLSRYYAFGHYGVSVLTRFFGLDAGTGFNLGVALRSAFDCFFTAAVAWRISRQKVWVTLLAPVLMEGAGNGLTAFFWWYVPHLDPTESTSVYTAFEDPDNHCSILKWINHGKQNELMPPGGWTWVGSFHSTCGGQFLVLFFIWMLTEVLRRKPANWPWICLGIIPLLTIVTSAWALPLEALFLVGTLFWIFYARLYPQSFRFVALGWGAVLVLLLPTLLDYLTTGIYYGLQRTPPEWRTPGIQLLVQWWPVYLPWLFLIFSWRRLSPALKTITFFLPIAFTIGEMYTVADRYDWTGKFCSFVFAIAWVALVPAVCARRTLRFRALTAVLIVSSLCSLWAWGSYTLRTSSHDDFLHLDGTGPYHEDPVLATLLETMKRVHGKTILTGQPNDGSLSQPLAAFTGNRVYLGWTGAIRVLQSGTYSPNITREREAQVDAFYDGKRDHPLLFLRSHDIDAAVIFPDDKISDDILAALKRQLAPYYDYVDCRCDEDTNSGNANTVDPNAGIFFFHPALVAWQPAQLMGPSTPVAIPAASAPAQP